MHRLRGAIADRKADRSLGEAAFDPSSRSPFCLVGETERRSKFLIPHFSRGRLKRSEDDSCDHVPGLLSQQGGGWQAGSRIQ